MNPFNLMGMISQIKSNPSVMLQRAGFNIPQNLNDPQQIINHLMKSGQVDQNRLNQVQQIASRFPH